MSDFAARSTDREELPSEWARRLAVYVYDIDGYDALPEEDQRICRDAAVWAHRELAALQSENERLKETALTSDELAVAKIAVTRFAQDIERLGHDDPDMHKALGQLQLRLARSTSEETR